MFLSLSPFFITILYHHSYHHSHQHLCHHHWDRCIWWLGWARSRCRGSYISVARAPGAFWCSAPSAFWCSTPSERQVLSGVAHQVTSRRTPESRHAPGEDHQRYKRIRWRRTQQRTPKCKNAPGGDHHRHKDIWNRSQKGTEAMDSKRLQMYKSTCQLPKTQTFTWTGQIIICYKT